MNFFRSGVSSLLGAVRNPEVEEETDIAVLTARLQTSTAQFEDIRATISQLALLIADHEDKFTNDTVVALFHVIPKVRQDAKTLREALELIETLVGSNGIDGQLRDDRVSAFSSSEHPIKVLLTLVADKGRTRLFALQILSSILVYAQSSQEFMEFVEKIITSTPTGIAHIRDTLGDERDVIRNQGLLVVTSLAKSKEEIQKILVFEGIFEALFGIIDHEGTLAGGVVVADSLRCMRDLLLSNQANQKYFREIGCFNHLASILTIDRPLRDLSATQLSVVNLMLELVHVLSADFANRTSMVKSKVLQRLTAIVSASDAVTGLRKDALLIVKHIVTGHKEASRDLLTHSSGIVVSQLLPCAFQKDVDKSFRSLIVSVIRSALLASDECRLCWARQLVSASPMQDGGSLPAAVLDALHLNQDVEDHALEWYMGASLLHALIVNDAVTRDILLDGNEFASLLRRTSSALKSTGASSQILYISTCLQIILVFLDGHLRSCLAFASSSSLFTFIDAILRSELSLYLRSLSVLLCITALPLLPTDDESVSGKRSSRSRFFDILANRIGVDVLEELLSQLSASPAVLRWSQVRPDQVFEVLAATLTTMEPVFDDAFSQSLCTSQASLQQMFLEMYAATHSSDRRPSSVSSTAGAHSPAPEDELRATVIRQEEELQKLRKENLALKSSSAASVGAFAETARLADDVKAKDMLIQTLRSQLLSMREQLDRKAKEHALNGTQQPTQVSSDMSDWRACASSLSQSLIDVHNKAFQTFSPWLAVPLDRPKGVVQRAIQITESPSSPSSPSSSSMLSIPNNVTPKQLQEICASTSASVLAYIEVVENRLKEFIDCNAKLELELRTLSEERDDLFAYIGEIDDKISAMEQWEADQQNL